MGRFGWIVTWAIRGFVVLTALTAFAGSTASSPAELAGATFAYLAIIYLTFRWTGNSGDAEETDAA